MPLLSIFKTKTLFDMYFSLPSLKIDFLTFFLSIYIHKSSSNLLLVDGGPNKVMTSLELFTFNFNKSYLSSIPTVPWLLFILLAEQLEIHKKSSNNKIL